MCFGDDFLHHYFRGKQCMKCYKIFECKFQLSRWLICRSLFCSLDTTNGMTSNKFTANVNLKGNYVSVVNDCCCR